jgi:NCAIR mutase (PurE)-related protein
MPEAVLCEGKDGLALLGLISELAAQADQPVLLTRMSLAQIDGLPTELKDQIDYDPVSRTGFLNGKRLPVRGEVAVVAAGTSDAGVALEAARTLEFLGLSSVVMVDVGVAGLWRLLDHIDRISSCEVAIAVAGMDGAMPTVLAGLVAIPVIGVPTSTGYGVAAGGNAALNAMLASCSQGIVVTNIDNGYGAACAAFRMIIGKNWEQVDE